FAALDTSFRMLGGAPSRLCSARNSVVDPAMRRVLALGSRPVGTVQTPWLLSDPLLLERAGDHPPACTQCPRIRGGLPAPVPTQVGRRLPGRHDDGEVWW